MKKRLIRYQTWGNTLSTGQKNHNLQGQCITGEKRGLYINNGKKVLVR